MDVIETIRVRPSRQGLHEITEKLASAVHHAGVVNRLCTAFIRHTSASLLIQENADPSARHDLEQ